MKKTTTILLYGLLVITLSCSKPNEPLDPQNPLEIDTLSTGWSQQKITDGLLIDIFFQDSLVGYAGGPYMFKTNDGGSTWIKFPDSVGVGNFFISPDGALNMVNGPATHVRKFTNWAQNSTTTPLIGWSSNSGDLYFTSINNGFLITDKAFFATTDGGNKWNQLNATGLNFTLPASYSGLCFLDSATGWVFNGKNIFKTNGTITDWISCKVPGSQTSILTSIQAASANIIYAGSFAGDILKSTDGGNNFIEVAHLATVSTEAYTDIHFLDDLNGYACNNNRIYQTNDGGVSWTRVVGLVKSKIIEIHFIDVNHGWACTTDGRVLKYHR